MKTTFDGLALDARNRAFRTFLVGLATDALAALGLVLTDIANSGHDVEWRLLPALLVKTVLASGGSYVLRRFGDPSNFWTPLPPTPQPAPAETKDKDDTF